MIKNVSIICIVAAASLLSGCASTSTTINTELKCTKVNGVTNCSGSIGTTTKISQLMNGLRPITDMLAQAGIFSYSDFIELKPSDYAYVYEGGTIENNEVTVSIYSDDSLVGTKSFSVVSTNGVYRFASPDLVKAYAEGFIDVATDVKVSAKTIQTHDTLVVKMVNNNETLALTTFRRSLPTAPPTHVK